MKSFTLTLLLLAAPLFATNRPNILFLLSDDQDWTETSVQMHPEIPESKSPHIKTPNLEILASQGIRFSQAYSPAPVCSPTRISLQTGKSPAQVNWTKAAPSVTAADGYKLIAPQLDRNIANDHITIAERLKTVGYATAHYGKWHIGGGGPEQHGYDESDGETSNGDAAPHMGDNPVDIFGMGERAMAFMEASRNAEVPFFIQMSYHALHYPQNARPDTYAKYQALLPNANEKTIGRAALADNLDEGIGFLLDKLDSLGIADNTYVIYMSDNGGGGNSKTRPLSGGKGDLKEGGIRVPLVIRGPGIANNSWSHQAVIGYDLFNTFSVLAGVNTRFPKGIEGGSLVPILHPDFPRQTTEKAPLPMRFAAQLIDNSTPILRAREGLFFHFPHYQGDTPQSAVILGNYKLIRYYETGQERLFHLPSDLRESNDLSAKLPEKVKELSLALTRYLREINASLPSPNPQHEDYTVDDSTDSLVKVLSVVQTNAENGAEYNLVLGSPKNDSIVVSVITEENCDIYFEYGANPNALLSRTQTLTTVAGQPIEQTIDSLSPNQKYYYRLRYATPGSTNFSEGTVRNFHTQRSRGETFTFLIEADPHYMDNDPEVWLLALQNMLLDDADFLLDLGDTFMSEKFAKTDPYLLTQDGLDETYEVVRSDFFATAAHSLPIFLVDGNHEAELGWFIESNSPKENSAVWGSRSRQKFFPAPTPDSFYSGAQNIDPYTQAPRDAYYAFNWGDALFIALDPYWYSSPKPNQSSWDWTLGKEQYDWLRNTLETSTARFKFVFAHHLIGGALGVQARGGKNNAHLWEWGGENEDGSWGFDTHRPGWGKPIQQLLLENGVQVFFHGHDHLYVKEELDADTDGTTDLIYQEVPQPSRINGGTNSAVGYGYTDGTVIGNSGHLRVTVAPTETTVEYVRVFLPENETGNNTNRMVSHSYTIPAPNVESGPAFTNLSSNLSESNEGLWVSIDIDPSQVVTPIFLVYNAGGKDYYLSMSDDGAHQDGAANDQRFGALIPPYPDGVTLNYYVFAEDHTEKPLYEPADAPVSSFQYAIPRQDAANQFRLPDTNQTQSFTETPGEDSDYTLAPPSFTDNGDGTVTDENTGLMWQATDGGEMTWSNALTYAVDSELAGHNDWRLPNSHELFSILDHGTNNPAMDTSYFPLASPAAQYWWASENRADDSDRSWAANVGGGIGPHPHNETLSAGGDKRFHARLVRGASDPVDAAPHTLIDQGDGTILDQNTGLIWQKIETANPTIWEAALSYAETLELAGHDDWRLPNIKELQSINDESRVNPSLDTAIFPNAQAERYWTSTSQNNQSHRAWFVDFRYGIVSQEDKTSPLNLLVVRGPIETSLATIPTIVFASPSPNTLKVNGPPDRSYSFEGSENLQNWESLFVIPEGQFPFTWTDPETMTERARFYQLAPKQ